MEGERARARARARVAQIRREIVDRITELNELLVLLDDGNGGNGRRRFTIIRGGALGIALLPLGILVRRPRHAAALGVTMVVLGALAAVLVVPGHVSPGVPGLASSSLSIPAVAPSLIPSMGATPLQPTPGATGGGATVPGAPSASVPPSPTRTPSAPTNQPTPSASTSVTTSTAPPTGIPTPSAPCLIRVTVTGILDVCVL